MKKPTISNHIEYLQGNTPIILSAPHGGDNSPKNIKDRTKGVFEKDEFTYELTQNIISEFYEQTGKLPYAIIAKISRIKVDINREEKEAYEDKKAKIIYDEFHSLIKKSKKEINSKYGKGLYFDIHGQSHPKAYLEFGYLLKNEILSLYDNELKTYQNRSSINTLSNFSKECFIDQLRGPHSMGSLMTNFGYDSIPSVKLPYASDNNYFEGAYDTIRYGSLDGGNISGIQIEFPYIQCRDTKENRKACAKAFVSSIIKFVKIHFQIDLEKN